MVNQKFKNGRESAQQEEYNMDTNKKTTVIALFGKSGSGKNTAQEYLLNTINNSNRVVPITTRPPRKNEIYGKDYYFLTNEELFDKITKGYVVEATSFKDWFYGSDKREFKKDKINIGVFNIYAIDILLEYKEYDVIPIYIDATPKVRLERCLKREKDPDCAEICRRFLEDEKDFYDIEFDYAVFENNSDYNDFTHLKSLVTALLN
jgi:guanylate kinase